MSRPKLPAPNEFTPGQLGSHVAIFELLSKIVELKGNRSELNEWIRSRWFSTAAQSRADDKEAQTTQQIKRANNVITGMQQLDLLEPARDPLTLSPLGVEILSNRGSSDVAFRKFARHILLQLHGLEMLEAAISVKARSGQVSKSAVNEELINRGFEIPTNSSYSGKIRAWLEPSGVVDSTWNVDETILTELTNVGSSDIQMWRRLTPQQKAVVEILRMRHAGNPSPIQSADLLELLRQRGTDFDGSQVARQIYQPLVTNNLITREVKQGGRGGKGGLISLTPYALSLDTDIINDLQLGSVPADLQKHLDYATETIISDLASTDTFIKGVALELLGLRMASDIGLIPIEMRLRSAQTGGAEIDLVAEGVHLHFSRWLFQCKNQKAPVSLDVLAKEVGMATLLKAQVVVIVTTGEFAKTVQQLAHEVIESTPIQVVLLDKTSLEKYKQRGAAALREELHNGAKTVSAA